MQYKQYGFPKLRPFLDKFQDILEFKKVVPDEKKPPVCYVRLKSLDDNAASEELISVSSANQNSVIHKGERVPSKNSWLFQWASIPKAKISQLRAGSRRKMVLRRGADAKAGKFPNT